MTSDSSAAPTASDRKRCVEELEASALRIWGEFSYATTATTHGNKPVRRLEAAEFCGPRDLRAKKPAFFAERIACRNWNRAG